MCQESRKWITSEICSTIWCCLGADVEEMREFVLRLFSMMALAERDVPLARNIDSPLTGLRHFQAVGSILRWQSDSGSVLHPAVRVELARACENTERVLRAGTVTALRVSLGELSNRLDDVTESVSARDSVLIGRLRCVRPSQRTLFTRSILSVPRRSRTVEVSQRWQVPTSLGRVSAIGPETEYVTSIRLARFAVPALRGGRIVSRWAVEPPSQSAGRRDRAGGVCSPSSRAESG